jgi:dTDP-L-rhamnose 4-epimerase
VLELAHAACRGTALAPRVVGGARLGDVRHIVASPALARTVLGFQASEPFGLDADPDRGAVRPAAVGR